MWDLQKYELLGGLTDMGLNQVQLAGTDIDQSYVDRPMIYKMRFESAIWIDHNSYLIKKF